MTTVPTLIHPPISLQTPPQEPPDVRLLLICQAEGFSNRYRNLAGNELSDDNSGLTALGWEQTNLLGAWLKTHERLDILFCGPQLRSRLTGQRLAQTLNLTLHVRSDLPNPNLVAVKSPGNYGEMSRLPSTLHLVPSPETPPSGEPPETVVSGSQPAGDAAYQQFCRDSMAVLDQVVQEHWGKSIGLVLSGLVLAAMVRHFFGAQFLPIALSHTAITELVRRNGQWSILYLNRREHLPVSALPSLPTVSPTQSNPAEPVAAEDLSKLSELYNRLALAHINLINLAATEPEKVLYEKAQAERLQRFRQLLKFAHLPTAISLLDAGSGTGQLTLELVQEGINEIIGVDISPAMLEIAEYWRLSRNLPGAQRVSFRQAALQALPFPAARFDAVLGHLLLHHSQKPTTILQEFGRVLKPGGILIMAELLSPDDPVKRATYNAVEERRDPAHAQVRSAEQLRKLITTAGFTIEAEKMVSYERELEEWIAEYQVEPQHRDTVRKMVNAGLETDATGLNARRQGERVLIEQKLLYMRAIKK